MSSIKLSPNASGTGIFTIAAPNSNTDRTLTLPDQTGTVLTNAGPFTANASASAGAVTIDASNNVGIGTSSPTQRLNVNTGTTTSYAHFTNSTTGNASGFVGTIIGNDSGEGIIWNAYNGAMKFATNNTERMRIDSSGNLLVGTTTSSARLTVQADSSSVQPVVFNSTAAGTGATSLVRFRRNGTNVGEIEITGSATSYVTSSDYRLKEDVQPMAGALAKVAALKPVTYKWKVDGSDGQGFIAHELQEVCPDAVSGEKDAVDEDGNIKPQGIDTSFLVATLTAAIQEQQALIESLTARIAALEAQP